MALSTSSWLGFPIPRLCGYGLTDSSDRMSEKTSKHCTNNPALDSICSPCSWHLHRRRILRNKEIGFHRGTMTVGQAEFGSSQLPSHSSNEQAMEDGHSQDGLL